VYNMWVIIVEAKFLNINIRKKGRKREKGKEEGNKEERKENSKKRYLLFSKKTSCYNIVKWH
jgi:hypothetical protein